MNPNSKALLVFFLVILSVLAFNASGVSAGGDDTCLSCHGQEGAPHYVDPDLYSTSVHANNGCGSCHRDISGFPHEAQSKDIPIERRMNDSCASCHAGAAEDFQKSIHGQLYNKGIDAAANCVSCHGSHDITGAVTKMEIAEGCASCHSGEPMETYLESFHGKAILLGSVKSATCTDCHGNHDITGPADPDSRVAPDNVPKTCASCHGQARDGFADGATHLSIRPEGKAAPVYYTEKFFTWLTILVITALTLHIEIELYGQFRRAGKSDDRKGGEE